MRKLFTLMLLMSVAVSLSAQESIRVQTHNVVAADEQFNVTFVIEGENKPSGFQWSPGEDFQLLWGPQQGHSTSIQMINGKTTKSVQTTFTYVLKPVKEGKFTLPSATAKVKNKDISSNPVSIEVVSSSSSRQSQPAQQQREASWF